MLTVLGLGAGGIVAASASAAEAAEPRRSEELLPSYVTLLARNVTWPGEATEANEPLRIGIHAEPAVSEMLARGFEGAGEKRRITVVRVTTPEQAIGCQVVYLHNPAEKALAGILAATSGKPVLTILNSEDRSLRGGIIELFLDNHNLRFLLNAHALRRAGLRASPELAQLSLRAPPR